MTVTDTLPVSVAFESATPSQGSCMHAAGTVTCDLGDVAEQATATVTIVVTPQAVGTIVNQASVDSPQGDDNPADNSDTEQTVVTGPTGYPRPKGATPLRVPLVPAYNQCTAPNRVHGPPLAFPSCSAPTQTSQHLTVGTPDANGKAANSVGFLRLSVVPDDQGTRARMRPMSRGWRDHRRALEDDAWTTTRASCRVMPYGASPIATTRSRPAAGRMRRR